MSLAPSHGVNGNSNQDSFDIRNSLRTITDATRHHKKTVVLTCVATLALLSFYIYVWPPIYKTEATLMAEPDYDFQRDSFYTGWDIFRKDEARSEIELISAAPVLIEVVQREGLTYDDVYHPVLDQLAYFWEKSWVGRNYRAFKKWVFPVDEKDAPTPEQVALGRTVAGLRASVELAPVGESNVGKLKIKGPSRRIASVGNSLLDVYLEHRSKRHQSEAQRSFDVLEAHVAEAAKDLKELTDRRVQFSKAHGLTFDLQKETMELNNLTELEVKIFSTRTAVVSLEASLKEIEGQLAVEPQTKTTSMVFELNARRETVKSKRLELQTALIMARNRFREDSPEVQEIKNDMAKLDVLAAESSERVEKATTEGINVVRQDLLSRRSILRTELAGSQAGLADMESTAAKMRSRLTEVPSLQSALLTMDRDLAVAAEQYKQMLVKHGQAAVALATSRGTMPSVRIVEYAAPPGDKYWPKPKMLYPIGLALGLMLGVAIAVALSYTSGITLKEHVEHGRGPVPLYGTISVPVGDRPMIVRPHPGKSDGPSPTRPLES